MRKNSSGFAQILIVILVLIAATSAGIYYLQTKSSINLPSLGVSPTPISTRPPMIEPPLDATSSWKTFSSDKFSLKYPRHLVIQEGPKDYLKISEDPTDPYPTISVDARLSGSYANYNQSIISTKEGLSSAKTEEISGGTKISGFVSSGYGEGLYITIALLKYQEGAIEFEIQGQDQDNLAIFNKILSTFKSLD